MSKKFLSDVLIECGLQVDGTTSLGTATATTVATSDNSTNIATTAWVKALGYSTTDSFISNVSFSGSTLSFTGINSAFTGSIDLSALSTQLTDIETVYASVRNVSGVLIPKGTPLATVIGQTSGNVSDVVPADASDPAFMPALFVADEDIAEEAEGRAVAYGEISGIDTSLYPSGTTVYVAPGGGWTDIKPTGTDLIQNLGVITKQHNTNGGGIVTGVGRSNDVPNIPQGYAWVGNANGVATPKLLGSLAYSSATYDNYGSWNLKTNGVQRTTVQSGGNLDIVAGTDISVSYGAGGVVTINSTSTGSIDYVSDVALNGNSLDFTGTGNAFAGSIDLSSLNAVSAIADLTDVDLTGLTNNAILKYDSVNQEWVVSTTNDTANATATAIVPFAIASVNTTSNGSGIGISWSNWNSSNATLDFTFSTPQPNTDYIVITDTEVFDNYYVGISNKTVNGFRAEFYDDTQSRTPSSFSEFSFIVYASDPTQQIKSSVGGINELSDVDTVTSAPSNGEALLWNGTNWVPGSVQSSETLTSIVLTGNTLTYRDENGDLTDIDLSLYLDDTNLARLTSGTLDAATGIATFTRDDSTTFTVDFSSLVTASTDTLDDVTGRGNTTTNAITVGGLTVDTNTLYVDTTNNRVGVGTTNPSHKFHVTGGLKIVQGASDQTVSADSVSLPNTTGAEFLRIEGNYTDGKYTHEWTKVDRGGNLPLYLRESKGTANSFSNLARFGNHSNSPYEFEVFGDINATGNLYDSGNAVWHAGNFNPSNYLTSETDTIDTVLTRGDVTNNTIHIRESDRAYTFRTSAGWGGWARTPFYFEQEDGSGFGGFGAYGGNGTTLSKYYIGSAYNNNIIEFHTDDSVIMQGNLGVGTTAAASKLHIKDDTSTVYDSTAYQKDVIVERKNTSGDNQSAHIRFLVTGYEGQTTGEASIGVIQTSNSSSGHTVFTNRNNGTRAETLRIQSDGKVGIGTPNPASKLEVSGTTLTELKVTESGSAVTTMVQSSTSYGWVGTKTNHTMYIGANDGAKMTILTDGSVGIGTTNPSGALHVYNGGSERLLVGSDVNVAGSTDLNITGANRRLSFTNGSGVIRTTTANKLFIETNSTTAITIDANQNVGIGNTNPTSSKLSVVGTVGVEGAYGSQSPDLSIGTPGWHKLGTFATSQGGRNLKLEYNAGQGYNANYGQHSILHIVFRTSNGSSQNNGMYASCHWYTEGFTSVVTEVRVKQLDASNYEFYVYANSFLGLSFVKAECSLYDEWINDFARDIEEPTDEVFTAEELYAIHSDIRGFHALHTDGVLSTDANLGVGTQSPTFTSGSGIEVQRAGTATLRLDSGAFATELRAYTDGTFLGQLSASYLDLGTNNTTRVRIDATGNVGINNTNPSQKLTISGGNILIANNNYDLRGRDTGGNDRTLVRINSNNEAEYGWSGAGPVKFMGGGSYTERMRIHTNGNVGIGNILPNAKLDIISTDAGSEGLRVDGASGGFAFVVKAGSDYTSHIRAGATIGVNYFTTPPSNGLIVEGNVGIGTTSPTEELHLEGEMFIQPKHTTGTPPSLYIGDLNNQYQSGMSSTGHLTFRASSTMYFQSGGANYRMNINQGGNVFIGGTTAASEKLEVDGNIKASGELVINGDIATRIGGASGTGNPVPQVIASLNTTTFIGAFIDFTIYDEPKENMRSGTLQLVFNANEVSFNEVNTVDIGDTTPCILTATNTSGIVSVLFEAPDITYHIKYQIRTL